MVFFNDERHTIGPLSRREQRQVQAMSPGLPAAKTGLVMYQVMSYLTVAGNWAACCWTSALSSDPHQSAEHAWHAVPGSAFVARHDSLQVSSYNIRW